MLGCNGLTFIFLDMPIRILLELLKLQLLLLGLILVLLILLLLLLVFCGSGLSVLSVVLSVGVMVLPPWSFNRCNPDCCSLAAILAMPK